jgi:CDP-diacylglycerol--glycerol-3-phosphate 3-phosphatidyltransferase
VSTTEPDIRGAQETRPVVSPLTRGALNLPNLITVSRLVLALVLFALIDIDGFWLTSAALFLVAAATDFLDGWVARRYGLVTTLGRILDPFVDKIIVCGAFIFLLEKSGHDPSSGVTAWMVLIVVGREMFITSLRGFMEQHGMDFSATWSGKWKMGVQCAAVVASLLSLSDVARESIPRLVLIRDVTLWAAVAITVWSGVVYVIRAARMLREPARAADA